MLASGERKLPGQYQINSPCLVNNARGVFSSRLLPSHSGGHSKVISIAYIVLSDLLDNSNQQLKGIATYLTLGFLNTCVHVYIK